MPLKILTVRLITVTMGNSLELLHALLAACGVCLQPQHLAHTVDCVNPQKNLPVFALHLRIGLMHSKTPPTDLLLDRYFLSLSQHLVHVFVKTNGASLLLLLTLPCLSRTQKS